MKRKQTKVLNAFRLGRGITVAIDRAAKKEGVSRTLIVERVLNDWFAVKPGERPLAGKRYAHLVND